VLRCHRCGATLLKTGPRALERALALTVAGLILLLIANLWPLMELDFRGDVTQATLATAALSLYQEGQPLLAVLVLTTVVAVPLLQIAALLYLLGPLAVRRRPPGMEAVFRVLRGLEPWGMLEVFTLGVLVTLVKLGHTADVIAGPALFALFVSIFVVAWITSEMERVDPWARLSEGRP
jgi:paraquat-inducible protein A